MPQNKARKGKVLTQRQDKARKGKNITPLPGILSTRSPQSTQLNVTGLGQADNRNVHVVPLVSGIKQKYREKKNQQLINMNDTGN